MIIGVFVGFTRILLLGILIFKRLTARRLYKSFGVNGLICGRALEWQSRPTHPVMSWTARIQRRCGRCYFGLEKLKNDSSVWHFSNGSKITEKKILVSKSTPEDKTIKYRRFLRWNAKKATISCVMSAWQFARPRAAARFPLHRRVLYFTVTNFITFLSRIITLD
jgi:hypothetical protein